MARKKKAHIEADESTPGAWVRELQLKWDRTGGVSAEFKRGRSPYVDVPKSDIRIPDVTTKTGQAKTPDDAAAELVRDLWRKCFEHAQKNGGRTDYRLVVWPADGSTSKAIGYCARGGRIDMRGDRAVVGAPAEEEEASVVAELSEVIGECREMIAEQRTGIKEMTTALIDMGKSCAEVVRANAEGLKAAAEISEQGIQRLRETASYDRETNERIEMTKLRMARSQQHAKMWADFLREFGPSLNAWGVGAWAETERKRAEKAANASAPDAAEGFEQGRGEDGGPSHLHVTRLAKAWADSIRPEQRTEMRNAIGFELFSDLLTVCTADRSSDQEFAAAYMAVAKQLIPHLKTMSGILDPIQKANFLQIHALVTQGRAA